ncbi:MAG: prepilin-type N-terminal cleavage/methylation domain-containing protein [Myxococcales bacterium]|nr:prepilin-type N-terminal cleavage/methylation domain-containing protein [Deltaproteobacteria bacterium]NND30835.1 prepilin-type N-terminal cleavage/methylation domain-containing protein [Myxococcales bacterium]MBT8480596.1 prepilin-type N-terminal cleavage/methylation domain-containing protein [Deltaproteobacteria bacterium]NNK07657.1 prepilin-type N-terminal cleavage/methylation domain-containing protein [Myxococcales bacterium]NNK43319.1 prepilin-type N-terminal cleavage/methylation domain
MKKNQGYTITELMITVVIIGVLATLAIPTFTSYIYKARVTEATNFLGKIKQRQESYRNEFGQYCAVDGDDWGTWNPAAIPGEDPVVWESTAVWRQLGASPNAPIRFQYATVAGVPGDAPPAGTDLDDGDHWFAARAQGDLNGDADTFYLEIYSQANHVYNSASGTGGWK